MEAELSIQNVLEEINKGFKTSAQDDKVIHRIFERIDYKKDNKIDKEELEHTLRSLGYEPVKINQYGISEVEQMIWEVDEDSDGCVSMEEFQMMFDRGRNDRTGHEPRKLFNLCQFMCLDRDGDGSISTEECMEMIMHRYGRNKMNEVFPERSDAQEREITLSDFLLQVNRSQNKAAQRDNKSNKMPSIGKKK
eukprot:CAMPEP_0179452364 /NCGR_PEP_ID=MMETSP0799-20121207/36243_1 /TAXON_ID=46947 /ORGANISM="Geminigera cryophila, Strain CCMP2564" /LENGTH=192 /DNA_ID=CAMNT_0021248199 /DNA_START=81 /DNA_END=659 /DNA_ORIENTATION=+